MSKIGKKDKKPLKKDKNKLDHIFLKSPIKVKHIESVFTDKH
jgi:hypothetical protein